MFLPVTEQVRTEGDLFGASGAIFSPCRVWRYVLWRIWDNRPPAMFIGLNPSTADETHNDPTVTRCIGYARDWNYGGLIMTNIFAFRATDPEVMKTADDPIGPENDSYLIKMSQRSGIVIAAWGNHGSFKGRGEEVIALIPEMHIIRLNGTGAPAHPLYLPRECRPLMWFTA